jgi:DNA modification methylase
MKDCIIYNKDSRKLSQFIKRESIDFIVFNPPYWNLRNYGFKGRIGFDQSYEEYLEDMKKVFKECYKVLKKGRFMAINIGTVVSTDGMRFISGDFVNRCQKIGFNFRKDIIWHKPRGTTKWQRGATQFSQRPYPLMFNININHEFILIFQKGENNTVKFRGLPKFNKPFIRKVAYSVWDIKPVTSPKKEEEDLAPFPEELPKRLIQLFTFKVLMYIPMLARQAGYLGSFLHLVLHSRGEFLCCFFRLFRYPLGFL